ncbi:MAG: TetR/AcrR family transcriptional regulator [Sandaracinus sp.]|nr:TetR/AcrR family transcriptional regulator [Sandaracinus sp.]
MNIPSVMSRLEERKAETRRRILRAALELFAERGFHGTAVPEVAERAEVGPGTIYRYVASKEELVNVLFRETKAKLGQALMHRDDPAMPPRERFLALWDRLYAFAESDPVAAHFLELQDHAPYLDATSRAVEHGVLLPVVEAVIAMQARGVLRTDLRPDVLIAFAWGGFVGLLKAERAGYLRLDAELVRSAALVWWRSVANDDAPKREPAKRIADDASVPSKKAPSKTAASKSAASKSAASKSAASKSTAPKSTAPKSTAPKSAKRRAKEEEER